MRVLLRGLLLAAVSVVPLCGAVAADSVDRSWTPTGNVEVADRFESAQPSGIARLPDGRVILSFPTSAARHSGPVLAVWTPGHLIPFPSAAAQRTLISPLGMTVDSRGHLWVLDEGVRAGGHGKAKPALIETDPSANRIVRRYPLGIPPLRPDSHVNDLRVDLTHGAEGTAFITDSSQTVHPALIVVDLATGRGRRLLSDTVSVMPVKGLVMETDGRLGRYDPPKPEVGLAGADGVTLSADSSRLYWSPMASRRLYSAPTAVLADPAVTEAQAEAAVRDEGEVSIADGMLTAPDGSLYLTDAERHAVIRRTPEGALSVVAQDPRLIAPDSMAVDGDSLLLTVGQWSRLPVFHDGKDMEERPWILVRITPRATPAAP